MIKFFTSILISDNQKKDFELYEVYQYYGPNQKLKNFLWQLWKYPIIGRFIRKKIFQDSYNEYDFKSTVIDVLSEILENQDKNIIFMTMKSNESIKK